MTPIEEAIRKVLPIEKWNLQRSHTWSNKCADELESAIPALVEMVERAHAEAISAAAEHTPMTLPAEADDPGWLISRGACSCRKLVANGVTPWNKLWAEHILSITPTLARLQQQKREQEMVLEESIWHDQFQKMRGKSVRTLGHEMALAVTCAAIETEERKVKK